MSCKFRFVRPLELGLSFALGGLRNGLSGLCCLLGCLSLDLSGMACLLSGVARGGFLQQIDVAFLDSRNVLLGLRAQSGLR